MKKRIAFVTYPLLFLFALVGHVNAEDQSFADQFLGSPLLILAVVFAVVLIAFVYHKLRK